MTARDWFDIAPKDAVNIELPQEGIRGPVNETGDPCPWPWEPQQLVGVPMGMYHCPYCSAMCVAGVRHPDYTCTCPATEPLDCPQHGPHHGQSGGEAP